MHHIELYVSDLEKTKIFYSWLLPQLGFYIYQEWEQGFSFKKDEFYLVFVQTQEKYLEHGYHRCHIGLNHLAFSCSSKIKIDNMRQQLQNKNIPLLYDEKYPYAGGANYYALFFEDPDRIKIEIALV